MLNDAKHFKEQRDEVRQWERMRDAKVRVLYPSIDRMPRTLLTTASADFAQDDMIKRHLLWRLYHITNEINESTRQVEEANEKLTELRTSVVSYSAWNIVAQFDTHIRTRMIESCEKRKSSRRKPSSTSRSEKVPSRRPRRLTRTRCVMYPAVASLLDRY
jgi:structural maintenance of chromosome 1